MKNLDMVYYPSSVDISHDTQVGLTDYCWPFTLHIGPTYGRNLVDEEEEGDPVPPLAKDLAAHTSLLCFDEFQVF